MFYFLIFFILHVFSDIALFMQHGVSEAHVWIVLMILFISLLYSIPLCNYTTIYLSILWPIDMRFSNFLVIFNATIICTDVFWYICVKVCTGGELGHEACLPSNLVAMSNYFQSTCTSTSTPTSYDLYYTDYKKSHILNFTYVIQRILCLLCDFLLFSYLLSFCKYFKNKFGGTMGFLSGCM